MSATPRNFSLTQRISITLILLQVFLVCCIVGGAVYEFSFDRSLAVEDELAYELVDSLEARTNGELLLSPTPSIEAAMRQPTFWFGACDESGHCLNYGPVPDLYRPLLAQLPNLERSEIRAQRGARQFAVKIMAPRSGSNRVHVILGGSTHVSTPWSILRGIFHVLGWWLVIPILVPTLILMPLLVRHALSGVSRLAAQAARIDFGARNARLSAPSIPCEIAPLVDAMNAALRRLSEGYEVRERFLTSAAHELRTPIAILELRVSGLEPGPVRRQLKRDVVRLSNLAEQLLDLQRIGKSLNEIKPIDLNALAREVVSEMAPLAIESGHDLALVAAPASVQIAGDPLALGRVLINLIHNALTHGGPVGQVTVAVHSAGALSVSDQGPGVPEPEKDCIFEPFYRIQPHSHGTGLGLHLVREVVALHGGRVEVNNPPEGGAQFKVWLPLATEGGLTA
jgi:two-component system, OmpR family, sensor histidine kinase TctE